jgi:hypothetical protein
MNALPFYFKVIRALEEIEAAYVIVGAFAGLAFGVNRVTFDIDILVDLRERDFEALAARFPPPRYYADPEMMRNATRQGIMFNLIDTELGTKAVNGCAIYGGATQSVLMANLGMSVRLSPLSGPQMGQNKVGDSIYVSDVNSGRSRSA